MSVGLADHALFTTGDIEHLPYEDAGFETVVCDSALWISRVIDPKR
ncbi:hypothetical protein [Streptomyces sp. NBC_01314]|nr:hypothetical protein OG622_13110 [Streptomyces sp. NBC_01314]